MVLMKKIKIIFPQITFKTKVLEITDEKAESLIEHREDEAKFIWDNMSEIEQNCSSGEEWIKSALSVDMAKINYYE